MKNFNFRREGAFEMGPTRSQRSRGCIPVVPRTFRRCVVRGQFGVEKRTEGATQPHPRLERTDAGRREIHPHRLPGATGVVLAGGWRETRASRSRPRSGAVSARAAIRTPPAGSRNHRHSPLSRLSVAVLETVLLCVGISLSICRPLCVANAENRREARPSRRTILSGAECSCVTSAGLPDRRADLEAAIVRVLLAEYSVSYAVCICCIYMYT